VLAGIIMLENVDSPFQSPTFCSYIIIETRERLLVV